jgi:hypothetical protein
MGMFDTVYMASNDFDSLPFTEEMIKLGLKDNTRPFQTKCLENILAEYTIQNGKLYIKNWKDKEESNATFNSSNESRESYLEEVYHHGTVFVYNFIETEKYDCWIEFKLTFTRGQVEKCELEKFEATDNAERKIREKKYQEEDERQRKKWYNKYFFNTRIYRTVTRKISRAFISVGGFIAHIGYKI